jgi:hypothetical protein
VVTAPARGRPWLRRGLLVAVAAMAVVAVLAGLGRLGLAVPLAARAHAHGPLFVLGVFQALIGLERAVALGRTWGYGAPILAIAGGAGMALVVPAAAWAAAAASVWLTAVNVAIVRRQAADFTAVMALGSLVLAVGALAWACGQPVHRVAPAWLAFFVLTIAAERLELSRLAPRPAWASRLFMALALLHAAATAAACLALPGAARANGVVLLGLAAWQLRFDLARRTLRRGGLPRFAALGVLLGTAWLAVAGALLVAHGLPPAGPVYDAVLHAVLVGFALSMVFAHAPIILPAVTRIELPFHPAMVAPLAVLHVTAILRVAGDASGTLSLREVGAVGNAVALALFALTAVYAARARRR